MVVRNVCKLLFEAVSVEILVDNKGKSQKYPVGRRQARSLGVMVQTMFYWETMQINGSKWFIYLLILNMLAV